MSKSNFFSLLNIGDMIEQSGNMRNCWEGENESYIQNVKREISTMKHNEKYLKTILTIILRTGLPSIKIIPSPRQRYTEGPVM